MTTAEVSYEVVSKVALADPRHCRLPGRGSPPLRSAGSRPPGCPVRRDRVCTRYRDDAALLEGIRPYVREVIFTASTIPHAADPAELAEQALNSSGSAKSSCSR